MKTFLKNIFLAIVRKIPAKDLNMKCMKTLAMSFPANRGTPEVYGRINMRHCNNFYLESLINVLRIYVFKFVMFIEMYSILQNHLPEHVPRRFSLHCEL